MLQGVERETFPACNATRSMAFLLLLQYGMQICGTFVVLGNARIKEDLHHVSYESKGRPASVLTR